MEHDAVQWEGAMVSYVNLIVEGAACLVYTWCVTFRGLSHLSRTDLGRGGQLSVATSPRTTAGYTVGP
jgi:hypothetical protein